MRVYRNIFLIITLIVVMTLVSINMNSEYKFLTPTYSQLTKDAKKQVDCLAQNIYHEAGHELQRGKVAVALVTLNRVEDPRYPKDICSVVKQKELNSGTCQFSWFCMPVTLNKNTEAYQKSLEVALYVYANYEYIEDITKGALFYHADYVNPKWKLEKTTVIGRHIFYKESGKQHDAKTKPTTKRRSLIEAFVLPTNGRHYEQYVQTSDRVGV